MYFIIGLLLLLIVVYLLFAFTSYFFTGAADQSKLNLPWEELKEMRTQIRNWTSVAGAYIAETCINRWFGLPSFAALGFLTVFALKLMNVPVFSLTKTFFHSCFWLIWLSVALSFILRPWLKDVLFFSPGGQHGDRVCAWMISYVGIPGIIFFLVGTLTAYCIYTFKATVPFIKSLFKKKPKKQQSSTVNKNTVAVGTEIVPEEWVENIVVETGADNRVEFTVKHPKEEHPKDEPEESIENIPENVADEERYDPTLDLSHYRLPPVELLKVYQINNSRIDMIEQNSNKDRITTTLQNYGIEIKSIEATVGPTITLYEIVPKEGVRIAKIRNLEYDIMLSLAATGIRIIAPIPGKGTIGIEVPNNEPQIVSMHSIINSKKFKESKFELPVAFGRTITNDVFMVDLAKMPHLLVAGATGQGKSVGLNAIITSLLYKKHPAELKFVLVDPKKVEFNIYEVLLKHFLAKLPDEGDAIITDTGKVVQTLNSICKEMDDRYDLLKRAHVRNLKEYNEKFISRQLNPEKGHHFLPYIVVIVDEFGDLIMTAGKEVEMPIARIAQLARAVGIHMIIATQRPSVNIITGVIKANFPARVAFRVSSMMDSRTILDAPGANQLVGRGDMLFSQGSDMVRVQCAFVDTPEVEDIVNYVKDQQGYTIPFYLPEYLGPDGESADLSQIDMTKRDPLFEEAARLLVANQQGSTSMIQRKLGIGYNRAGRLMDQLEVAGIVGPSEGSKARQVLLMSDYDLEQKLAQMD
jgi:S-DNA-T family DNA segregation ATPase FtsK/SpoIIIE